MPCHVSKTEFAELVERAIAELPPQFARVMEESTIEIKDRPSRKLLKEMGMEADELLFGLYEGVSLLDRSVEHSGRMPDRILIFQEDHELACETRAELVKEIRTTVLHEIGHFFGMDEDDLGKLGYD
ncbi:MAG: metallopeptidase family protein [Phycisphaerae bacterium]|nr:metallopeptidase family protein [Tepidisphaeraceae bacterium]